MASKFAGFLAFIPLLVTLTAGSATADIIYSEDFESGTAPGFLLTGGNDEPWLGPAPILWHVTSNFPFGGSYALGYVQNETQPSTVADGNYNVYPSLGMPSNGSINGGFAISPTIVLPTTGATTLQLEAFNHNEYGDAPAQYDWLNIGISPLPFSPDIGYTWLASTASTTWFPEAQHIDYWTPTNTGYQNVLLDLSAYDGMPIQLVFWFYTSDGADNNHPGARIDNIVVINSSVPEPATFALLGLGLAGLGFMRRRGAA